MSSFLINKKKNLLEMQKNGKTTAEIAQTFNVSRQTISKYLNKPLNGNYVMPVSYTHLWQKFPKFLAAWYLMIRRCRKDFQSQLTRL